jgi:ABC-type sugar transport system permease subunit
MSLRYSRIDCSMTAMSHPYPVHVAVEGMSAAISLLMSLFILIISYVYFTKLNKYKTVIGD